MSVTDSTTPDEGDAAAAVDAHIVAALTELQTLGRCIAELDEILTAGASQQTGDAR